MASSSKKKTFQLTLLDQKGTKVSTETEGSLIPETFAEVMRGCDSVACVTFKGKDATLFGRSKKRFEEEEKDINTATNCLFSKELYGPALVVQKTSSKKPYETFQKESSGSSSSS